MPKGLRTTWTPKPLKHSSLTFSEKPNFPPASGSSESRHEVQKSRFFLLKLTVWHLPLCSLSMFGCVWGALQGDRKLDSRRAPQVSSRSSQCHDTEPHSLAPFHSILFIVQYIDKSPMPTYTIRCRTSSVRPGRRTSRRMERAERRSISRCRRRKTEGKQ